MFALYILQERSQIRAAKIVQLGIVAGAGKRVGAQLTRVWFEALYNDRDRAEFEYQRYQAN
ncbi:MAG: hypothetical protein KF752_11700 [Pirellulaceae bacterium]|nr:hypothetical protein [Pirellulaceae bacterium]